ncbi:Ig-like domain-containing protein [Myxococcota bacterium]
MWHHRCVAGFSLLLLTSCAADELETALDIRLLPDTNLNNDQQVLAPLTSLWFIVDGPVGAYPADREQAEGNPRIIDIDDDGALELVEEVAITKERLPVTRLLQGGLPDGPLDVQVWGFGGDSVDPIAAGITTGLRFETDTVVPVTVGFNLVPAMLPPRVVAVFPGEGYTVNRCKPGAVLAVFSKPVEPSTVATGFFVEGISDATPIGDGSLAYLQFADILAEGSHTIRMSSAVTDLNGQPLDQEPTESGAQSFSSSFFAEDPGAGCHFVELPMPCDTAGEACPYQNADLVCSQSSGLLCQPRSCEVLSCPDVHVCNPAAPGCEVDCRAYGPMAVCPEEKPHCGDTGWCEP